MSASNYEILLSQMPARFLQYDQRQMIDRFHLSHDGVYLYLRLLARQYRVGRTDGTIEWSEDGTHFFPGGFYDSMTIYDLLCCAKEGCRLSGRYCRAEHLPGTAFGANPAGWMCDSFAQECNRAPQSLASACEKLGGVPLSIGEISYRIPVFDMLPVIVQFWSADEDFPPEWKLMWDENSLQFLKYETLCYAAQHLIDQLRAQMAAKP